MTGALNQPGQQPAAGPAMPPPLPQAVSFFIGIDGKQEGPLDIAGLQARFGLDAGKWTAEQMAQVALDSLAVAQRTDAEKPAKSIDELLARPYFADPLRRHDIAPITDGASAIVLASG